MTMIDDAAAPMRPPIRNRVLGALHRHFSKAALRRHLGTGALVAVGGLIAIKSLTLVELRFDIGRLDLQFGDRVTVIQLDGGGFATPTDGSLDVASGRKPGVAQDPATLGATGYLAPGEALACAGGQVVVGLLDLPSGQGGQGGPQAVIQLHGVQPPEVRIRAGFARDFRTDYGVYRLFATAITPWHAAFTCLFQRA